jgi:energy-coupling factor transport system ATP-binding protein
VTALLEVRDLSFRYPSYPGFESRPLFEHLDLEVRAGQCVRVLGGPETGKSTLARVLCGLVPRYTGGEIRGDVRVAGNDCRAVRPCDQIETVGITFQNPDEQIVTTRCSSEVSFPLESLGVEPREIRSRVDAALGWAGLGEHAGRSPLTLSGGEKRRLLLACLHALRPGLWLLDETVEEIDAGFRTTLVRHLRETGATAVFFASKELALEAASLDATYLLAGGRLVAASSPAGPAPRDLFPSRVSRPAASRREVLGGEGIELAFRGGGFRLAVDRISVADGEVVALTGANGAGKTTLARVLCGLARPQRGEVRLGGAGPAAPELLRSAVAYVFQNPDYQLYLPTVGEELEFGLLEAGVEPAERARRVREAVDLFRLAPPEAPPALLSYGMRKRLQMAVCYLLRRAVVILDEADAGLAREEFAAALLSFTSQGASVIVISHDQDLTRGLADRVLSMEHGAMAC